MRRLVAVIGALVLAGLTSGAANADSKKVLFQLQDDRITESSGLAASAVHPGIVYTHNDSGHPPQVFAIDSATGNTVATLTLKGAPARDWEAISKCKESGTNVLWVGDIGDNIDAWKTYRLYKVAEPATLKDQNVPYTPYVIRYADRLARNAESLLCDPKDGRLYIVTKEAADKAGVYRGPATMRAGTVNVFTKIAGASAAVTDAAFFDGGRYVVTRGYFDAHILRPDLGWKSIVKFTPPIQIQGESVAETADGTALLFGSEGVGSSVWRVPIPDDVTKISGSPVSSADAKDAVDAARKAAKNGSGAAGEAKKANDRGIPGIDGQMVALVSAVGLGVLVLVLATRRD